MLTVFSAVYGVYAVFLKSLVPRGLRGLRGYKCSRSVSQLLATIECTVPTWEHRRTEGSLDFGHRDEEGKG